MNKLADSLEVDRERLRGWTLFRAVESGTRALAAGRRQDGGAAAGVRGLAVARPARRRRGCPRPRASATARLGAHQPCGVEAAGRTSGGCPVRETPGQARGQALRRRATASVTVSSSRSPVRRSFSSTTPSAARRPATRIFGTPISSASVNFTPGRDARRGRRRAPAGPPPPAARRPPGPAPSGAPCPRRRRGRRPGRSRAASTGPCSSAVCSASAATARETPMPYEPIVTRTGLPFWPRTSSWKASAYLRPSWKMWPISMARSSLRPGAALGAGVARPRRRRRRGSRRPRSPGPRRRCARACRACWRR